MISVRVAMAAMAASILLLACGGSGPAPANMAPTATLAAPATAAVGAAVTLTATATDTDGSVTKVEFFDGTTKIGEVLVLPFTLAWTPNTAGAHDLTVMATDNLGLASAASPVVTVTVAGAGGDSQLPVATLIAPANFATGLTGTLTLTATATDNVGVTGVEFQVDGAAVGTLDTSAPYAQAVDTAAYASGQHIVRARARDAAGNLSAWATATVQFGGSRTQPAGFTRSDLVTMLNGATAFAQAPAPDGRFFVAEQGGTLRVVKNGVLLTTPFITLTVDSNGERGLIGVTLHPDFANNHFVYLYYTTPENGIHNRISRFTTGTGINSDTVSVGSELRIADLPALNATNHNGGAMHFGSDGKLYVGVGENANGANAPDLNTPLGKLLRFNDDGSIPNDNPFCTTAATLRCAVFARGLRNPFTFAVQPGTGTIHINDVGENTWEEINVGAAGANYGWPATEGPTTAAGVAPPLFTYKHSAAAPPGSGPGGFFVGNVIAGGTFYPAAGTFPAAYRGSYYFADFGARFIGRLDLVNTGAAYAFGNVSDSPVDMLVGLDGALHVLTRGSITRFSAP